MPMPLPAMGRHINWRHSHAVNESDYIDRINGLPAAAALRIAEEGLCVFPTSAKLLCGLGDLIQLQDGEADHRYRLSDALAAYEQAIELDPACAEGHESIGYYCDVLSEDLQRAEAEFQRAIELGAGEDSYAGLARVRAELGCEAAKIFEFLDSCPYANGPQVCRVRHEIDEGSWRP